MESVQSDASDSHYDPRSTDKTSRNRSASAPVRPKPKKKQGRTRARYNKNNVSGRRSEGKKKRNAAKSKG